MKRSLIFFMVLGLIAGSMGTAEAEQRFERTERTVEVNYYGAQLAYQFRSCAVSGGVGCVTIETLADEDFLTASATDAHGGPVSVWVVDASERQDDPDGSDMYGTFCGHTTEPIRFDPGAKLELWVGTWWPTWRQSPWFVPEGVGCFPGVATTGTVRVTLTGWTISERPAAPPPDSGSPAPQPSPTTQPEAAERSVDLALHRHLRSEGMVASDDPSCRSNVTVAIERKTSPGWVEVGSTTTDDNGAFFLRLTDRPGRYRAVASEIGTPETTCLMARSTTVKHHH